MRSIEHQQDQNRSSSRVHFFWNLLTVIILLGIVCLAGVVGLIYVNPYILLNPFPPPTQPALVVIPTLILPTSTRTPLLLPPTWTATVTGQVAASSTPTVRVVTAAPSLVVPSVTGSGARTPTATLKIVSAYPFALQSPPAAIGGSVLYPERGCKWTGVGGQALDMQGRPALGISIQMGGTLDSKPVFQTSLTGTALKYGPAGFEFALADAPLASKNVFWVRLVDQAGIPLSDRVYFETFDSCEKNLVVVNFKQVR